MPGGNKNIKPSDGTPFTSENQPTKRRGVSLVSKLKQMLQDDPETTERILKKMIAKAEDGDLKAVEMILDRTDGKPVQHTVNENTDIKPVKYIDATKQ